MFADNDELTWSDGLWPVAVFEELSDGVADAQAGVGGDLDLVELELAVSAGNEVDVAALAVGGFDLDLDSRVVAAEIVPQRILESPMPQRDLCLSSLPGRRRASGACVVLQRVIRFEDESALSVEDRNLRIVRFAVALDEFVDRQERVEVLQDDVNDIFVGRIDRGVFAEENEGPVVIEAFWHGLGRTVPAAHPFGCPIPHNETVFVQVVGVILEKSAKPAELRVHLPRVGHRLARL